MVTGFAAAASLFVYAGFSFGYLVRFYAYSMILGYLWLNCFSQFQYDHVAAGISAAVSAIAFLLPALLITSPIARPYEMPERIFWRLVTWILVFGAATAATAAAYNFRSRFNQRDIRVPWPAAVPHNTQLLHRRHHGRIAAVCLCLLHDKEPTLVGHCHTVGFDLVLPQHTQQDRFFHACMARDARFDLKIFRCENDDNPIVASSYSCRHSPDHHRWGSNERVL